MAGTRHIGIDLLPRLGGSGQHLESMHDPEHALEAPADLELVEAECLASLVEEHRDVPLPGCLPERTVTKRPRVLMFATRSASAMNLSEKQTEVFTFLPWP